MNKNTHYVSPFAESVQNENQKIAKQNSTSAAAKIEPAGGVSPLQMDKADQNMGEPSVAVVKNQSEERERKHLSQVSNFSFLKICRLFENIQSSSSKSQQFSFLEHFWKQLNRKESFFPYMRLLLPQLDNERALYNIKENRLARLYVDVLGLAPKSREAQKLLHWKDPSHSAIETTSFSDVVFIILQNKGGFNQRQTLNVKKEEHTKEVCASKSMSVEDINAFLDEFAAIESVDERKLKFIELLKSTTPLEQKWLLRIILKDMKFRMTHQSILFAFHPTALDKYNNTNDLRYVCESCVEEMEDSAPGSEQSGIFLYQPLRPMLASPITSKKLELVLQTGNLTMEPKYDGERIMIHIGENKIMYWTRNAKNYTSLYGPKFDETLLKAISPASESNRPKVENIILDGEFLVFDSVTGHFSEFGVNRTFANTPGTAFMGEGEVDGDTRWFCYMVFDIVFLNGQSLMEMPHHSRRSLLKQVLKENTHHLEIVPSETVRTSAEILKGLERAVEDKKEGVVLKNAMSPYVPAERKNNWLKLKVDHLAGLADSMDLIVVGGYYGTKFGQRHLSHFVLATWDDKSGKGVTDCMNENAKFHTVCKIGNGYTGDELMSINAALQPHLETMPNRDVIPAWLDQWRPAKRELIPDVYIHPKNSIVLEVFGFAFTEESVNYRVGFTVRFPRMLRIRWDKSIADATTLTNLCAIRAASKDSLREKLSSGKDMLLTVLAEKWKRRRESAADNAEGTDGFESGKHTKRGHATGWLAPGMKHPTVLSDENLGVKEEPLGVATIKDNKEQIDALFSGYQFCVLFVSPEVFPSVEKDVVRNKTSFEKFLLRHGAEVVANPGKRTSLLLASTPTAPKVANWIQMCQQRKEADLLQKYASVNVAHCNWVFACVEAGAVLPLSPQHLVYGCPSLMEYFRTVLDPYHDAYFELCTMDSLKLSLSRARKAITRHPSKRNLPLDSSTQTPQELVKLSCYVQHLREEVGINEGDNRGQGVAAVRWRQPPFRLAESIQTSEDVIRQWLERHRRFDPKYMECLARLRNISTRPDEINSAVKIKKEIEDDEESCQVNRTTEALQVLKAESYEIIREVSDWSIPQLLLLCDKVLKEKWYICTGGEASQPDLVVDPSGKVWRTKL